MDAAVCRRRTEAATQGERERAEPAFTTREAGPFVYQTRTSFGRGGDSTALSLPSGADHTPPKAGKPSCSAPPPHRQTTRGKTKPSQIGEPPPPRPRPRRSRPPPPPPPFEFAFSRPPLFSFSLSLLLNNRLDLLPISLRRAAQLPPSPKPCRPPSFPPPRPPTTRRMEDKENAAPALAAVGPRLTRAAARRAAAEAAAVGGGGPAKRKRVALGELPTLTNAPARPAKKSKPAKPAARPAKKEALKPATPSPPRAAVAEAEPHSSASSSSPPRAPTEADPSTSTSSSSPPRAVPVADPCTSASYPPPARTAAADAQLCPMYVSDIYTYLGALEAEPRRRPRADYVEAVQKDVSANMRAILVDWLVEVAEEYKLVADTLYLAVYYVDRFLSVNPLGRDKLQLLGVAAMLIAAKYEEISPPHVGDFCYITDNTYTKHELLQMEGDILKLLQFELGNPTIKTFLRRFTRAAHEDTKRSILLFEFLGSYLAELSLLDYACLQYLPSLVAASVVFLARLTIDPHSNPWNYKLQKMTGYKVSELKDCIIAIHSLQLNRKCSSSTAIRDKYNQHKFKCVSALLPPVVIPASYFEDLTE